MFQILMPFPAFFFCFIFLIFTSDMIHYSFGSTAYFLQLDVWASPKACAGRDFELGAAVYVSLLCTWPRAPRLDTPHPT